MYDQYVADKQVDFGRLLSTNTLPHKPCFGHNYSAKESQNGRFWVIL